jgi:uncharacterized protein
MAKAMAGRAQESRFDAFRLAASRGELSGRVDPAGLPRLEETVAAPGGHVEWTIRGGADAEGRPAITVSIAGAVPLTCQRCLGTVTQAVGQSTLLLLARDDADLVRLDEASGHEVVAAREPLDPRALVEDELLLGLPFAPRHEGECATPVGGAKE